ncbi:RES family NAD+ phosphorylase [uncultured Roseobacter sp.]|uniref:RES family NAD+ phosphorylase n=1 Tax=uncultured Roseobacter sp. TaxID=114847 RepID=UPI00260DEB14|nr:RES family NAD+ phosphorylase [uncultured Roseobacter sp.]
MTMEPSNELLSIPTEFIEISGCFVRIEAADASGIALQRGHPHRPPARFNRCGEDALYLSPDAESAHVAIGGDVTCNDSPRVLARYKVARCKLVDLRSKNAAKLYELARCPWRTALESGEDPPSWTAADIVRESGAVGLIDPSRRRAKLWHVTLFRWNEPRAPKVSLEGPPEQFAVTPGYR